MSTVIIFIVTECPLLVTNFTVLTKFLSRKPSFLVVHGDLMVEPLASEVCKSS